MAAPAFTDITVVITCFNYGEYLGEAIDSVLAQEDVAPRVIVVDDGSTDRATLAVLDTLPEGVDLIRQSNQGLAAARNTGFRAAESAYLLPLDADDRLPLGTLAALRGALDEHPQAGFSYGYAHIFGDWDTVLRTPPYDPFKLLYRHMIGATCLMRRALFEDVGGYDSNFPGYEDWEFWVHALAHGWRGVNIERVTLDYRRHGHTMLSDARRSYRRLYGQIRTKHAEVYARAGELARETGASRAEQLIYKWFWGARPIPARVEQALHGLLFRDRG